MTLDKLIEEYEWTKRKKREYDFSQHIKMKYMPYVEKCALVKSVLDSSSYVEIGGKKTYRRNTAAMLFAFAMQLIERYTDIEFENNNVVQVYDTLMETGLMNSLMSQIPDAEINILRGMLDMQRDDEEANTRSLISFFETKYDAMQMAMESMRNVLESPEVRDKVLAANIIQRPQ